jgi:hypothetical protein
MGNNLLETNQLNKMAMLLFSNVDLWHGYVNEERNKTECKFCSIDLLTGNSAVVMCSLQTEPYHIVG